VTQRKKMANTLEKVQYSINHGVPLKIAEQLFQVGDMAIDARDEALSHLNDLASDLGRLTPESFEEKLQSTVHRKISEAFRAISDTLTASQENIINNFEALNHELDGDLENMLKGDTAALRKSPVKKAIKKTTKKAVKKATKKATKKAVKKATKKAVKKATKKAVKKATKKAVKKATKKAVKKNR